MTGLAYHRISQDLSCRELAKKVDCPEGSVRFYEKHLIPQRKGRSSLYIAFSDALGVPIQELLRTDMPQLVDRKSGLIVRPGRTANPGNPIAVYRSRHRLTFKEIAVLLGNTTREAGRLACARAEALEEHIVKIAAHEKLTPKEFTKKYRTVKEEI